jgi:hypothetical protein
VKLKTMRSAGWTVAVGVGPFIRQLHGSCQRSYCLTPRGLLVLRCWHRLSLHCSVCDRFSSFVHTYLDFFSEPNHQA